MSIRVITTSISQSLSFRDSYDKPNSDDTAVFMYRIKPKRKILRQSRFVYLTMLVRYNISVFTINLNSKYKEGVGYQKYRLSIVCNSGKVNNDDLPNFIICTA